MQVRFTQKIDIPRFVDVRNVRVGIGHDWFIVEALFFKTGKPLYWKLKLNTYQHILPSLSWYEIGESSGIVELTLEKPLAIAWRNIHYQATVIFKNQYAWTEINEKYRAELEDDWAVFGRAQKRFDEVEDLANFDLDKKIFDKRTEKSRGLATKRRVDDEKFYTLWCSPGNETHTCETPPEDHWSYWHS